MSTGNPALCFSNAATFYVKLYSGFATYVDRILAFPKRSYNILVTSVVQAAGSSNFSIANSADGTFGQGCRVAAHRGPVAPYPKQLGVWGHCIPRFNGVRVQSRPPESMERLKGVKVLDVTCFAVVIVTMFKEKF